MNQLTFEEAYAVSRIIGYAQFAIGTMIQVAILALQVTALRRHRKRCFALLALSTCSGLLGIAAALANLLLPVTPRDFMLLVGFGFLLFCFQGIFAFTGILKLLRDYASLSGRG